MLFNLYLYGDNNFTVITDHLLLEGIFNKPLARPPACIERWLLKLQPYTFTVKYQPGAKNPADFMSRYTHRIPEETNTAEVYAHYLAENAVPKSVAMDQIKADTKKDDVLQMTAALIRSQEWYTVQNYEQFTALARAKDELTVSAENDFIMKGHLIIIPTSLRQRVVELAHEGHQGIRRTKALLREKVWFPGIDHMAEKIVKDCLACQATTHEQRTLEPIITRKMANHP